MRTLATTLKTLLNRRAAHCPQSSVGIGLRLRSLPSPQPLRSITAVPLGIDETGQPLDVPRGMSVLIAGDPRTRVTTALRTLALGYARFPGTRLHVYEADLLGDLSALRGLAHRYIDTTHGSFTIPAATDDLNHLADLIERRAQHLADLNADLFAAEEFVRRVTGKPVPRLTSLDDMRAVEERVWAATGIHPDRIDPETADLHPHVVVIGHAIRWALSDRDAEAFTTALTRVTDQGAGLGVTVLLGTDSSYLSYFPADLAPAFRYRISTGLTKPVHADQVLGALARQSGIDTTPDRLRRPGQGWIADLTSEPVYQPFQVYDANPHAFRADCLRLTRSRARSGWLTGDAATRSGK
ncbi:hypothetical protein F1D05_33455 [Kribbella qitaiheensis]|uniref:FtsK domain-containing protein n=1 Tax=Kribbella qitaiheensis TaxID=1544730 RepID=A0A7G6X6R3_9ACTN|nr:hypothetical protein [Kribbella qitaiheensis]QNE21928.1 hypothetical protein F1D05_33455 [Kribbella qitaiheensis]